MKNPSRSVLALAVLALSLPSPAAASVAISGPFVPAIVGNVRGNDVAYDSLDRVYLVVSAQGTLQGRFIDANGSPIGAQFVIQSTSDFTQYPRVAFSPDADGGGGAFLVTWNDMDLPGSYNSLHTRMVSFKKGGPIGTEFQLTREATWWENGAGIGYSTVSHEFLVTYALSPTWYGIHGIRVGNNAAALDVPFEIKPSVDTVHYPAVAYNPVTNQYLVTYSGYSAASAAGYAEARLIQAGTNQMIGSPIALASNTGTWITNVTYNPQTNEFLTAWFELSPRGVMGQLVAANGSLVGNTIVLSTRWAGTDALGLAYNPRSNSIFMSSNDSISVQTGGVELDGNGNPVDGGLYVTTTGSQTQFSRVAASTDDPSWLVCLANNYDVTMTQLVRGTAASQPPVVTQNPTSVTVHPDGTVAFGAAASGAPTPSVQWYVSADGGVTWAPIGTNSLVLSFVARPTDTHKKYMATFTNSAGSASTTAATLTVDVPADFDGDGVPDPLVWRPSTGQWFWRSPTGSTTLANGLVPQTTQWGTAGDIPLAGDLDGDGIPDLIVWRPSAGTWFWLTSSTGYSTTQAQSKQWGNQALGDVPLLADIDGDNKADLIIWRASTGTWYWLTSSSGYNYTTAGSVQWGNKALGDTPLTGDFDGDGKADLVVWRASTGTWYWLTSSSGYSYASAGSKQWGNQALGDEPLIGDLDADGLADLVVWRASTGTWYWLTSSSGYNYASAGAMQWGNASLGDVPSLADVDGDGRSDLTVFRPGTGMWFTLTSSSGYLNSIATQWGMQGDVPLMK